MAKKVSGERITKAEAARRWGVSPSMIPRYLRKGMPDCADGGLDWLVVDQWRVDNITPERSGSWKARNRDKTPAPSKSATNADSDAGTTAIEQSDGLAADASAVELLTKLHQSGMVELGRITEVLGLPPASQCAVVHIACAWLWSVAGDVLMAACGENGPAVDYTSVAEIELTSEQEKYSDALVDAAETVLALI